MPELLTRGAQAVGPGPPARWPASSRNGGRLQFGMVAGFKSESRPAHFGIPEVSNRSAAQKRPRHESGPI